MQCHINFIIDDSEGISLAVANANLLRRQAKSTGRAMIETYTRFGYQIVELPFAWIEAHADFVTDYLGLTDF